MDFAVSAVLVLVVAVTAQARTFNAGLGDTAPDMVTETDPRYKVPKKFLLGAGTSAYQTEGAWNKDGKGENVFDHTYHTDNYPINMTGDIACNSYERYEEDIRLAGEMNLDVYRFSISWSRIFPDGDPKKKNDLGVQHYHNVINTVKKYNMKPMVTIYHFDHPQALETKFGGWQSEEMIESFVNYADFIFSEYGKEIDHWVTINEPNMQCVMVYMGGLPPGNFSAGYKPQDIYRCIHHEILAHAQAYRLYQRKYKKAQGGVVGFGGVTFFSRPNSTDWADILAAERANMFDVGFLLHPLVYGDYPDVAKETLRLAGKGDYLPVFSEHQKNVLKGSIDFLGVNAYFGQIVADPKKEGNGSSSGMVPMRALWADADVKVIGYGDLSRSTGSSGFGDIFSMIAPSVLGDIGLWIKARFGPDVGIFITENGCGSLTDSLDDWDTRAVYHSAYLRELMRAINEDGANVIGYTVWSLVDDFEFSTYERRFGLVHIDYEGGTLDRTLKRSHHFFKRVMQDRTVPLVEAPATNPATPATNPATPATNPATPATNPTTTPATGASSSLAVLKPIYLILAVILSRC